MDGVNQIQVNAEGLTFASGLRSLASRPGCCDGCEIAIMKTANLAIQAGPTALAPHFTLISASLGVLPPRLLDMGN